MRNVQELRHCGRNAKRRKVDLERQQKLLDKSINSVSPTTTSGMTKNTGGSTQFGNVNNNSMHNASAQPQPQDNNPTPVLMQRTRHQQQRHQRQQEQRGPLNHQQSLPYTSSLPSSVSLPPYANELPQFSLHKNGNRGDGKVNGSGMSSELRPFSNLEIVDFDSLDVWNVGHTFSLSSDPFERYLAETLFP
jgi:hypothetical protein